jgi:hypothetical protein
MDRKVRCPTCFSGFVVYLLVGAIFLFTAHSLFFASLCFLIDVLFLLSFLDLSFFKKYHEKCSYDHF